MREPVVHLIVGPERHGVVRFGVELQAALEAGGVNIERVRAPDHRAARARAVRSGQGVHLQFTDRLFGSDARQAVVAVGELAADVRRGGGRVTATLHDLPQPSDGANYGIRARAYASLVSALDGVAVSSEHERTILYDMGVQQRAAVIPLPIAPPVCGPPASRLPPSVAVFGFVYPGKGHVEVLDAMAGLPSNVRMMAVGEPSAGHGHLVDELEVIARAQGRPFTLTGHVSESALVPLLQSVTVPVVHHRHVSASGSLNSWITAGRRPLVPATRYIGELAERNPGALWLHDDDRPSLSAAIRAALDEPSATWLPPGLVCSPTPAAAAADYGHLLRSVHR